MAIISGSGTTLNAEVGKYYKFTDVGTLSIVLPTPTGNDAKQIIFFI